VTTQKSRAEILATLHKVCRREQRHEIPLTIITNHGGPGYCTAENIWVRTYFDNSVVSIPCSMHKHHQLIISDNYQESEESQLRVVDVEIEILHPTPHACSCSHIVIPPYTKYLTAEELTGQDPNPI